MEVEIVKKGKKSVITITAEVNEETSKSGKSIVLATTRGNQPTGATYDGKPVIVGLNAYVRK